MHAIAEEAERAPALLREAPHDTPIGRLDEATAARHPVLRWSQPAGTAAQREGVAESAALAQPQPTGV